MSIPRRPQLRVLRPKPGEAQCSVSEVQCQRDGLPPHWTSGRGRVEASEAESTVWETTCLEPSNTQTATRQNQIEPREDRRQCAEQEAVNGHRKTWKDMDSSKPRGSCGQPCMPEQRVKPMA